jgi:hypothetical protein
MSSRRARIEAFWIDTWIKKHYQGAEILYIIHDAESRRGG